MKITIDGQNITIDNENQSSVVIKATVCRFTLAKNITANQILELISAAKQQIEFTALAEGKLSSLKINFTLTNRMHQIIREGTYLQRIQYIQLVGKHDSIFRQDQFSDAVAYYNFDEILRKERILNYLFSNTKSRRIIAVHFQYAKYDEEIREGLHVMPRKHPTDNCVFVENEEALEYAVGNCSIRATLVIDGHWLHNEECIHGVWDKHNAEELAHKIADIVNTYPGQIAHINLLGCETGHIAQSLDGRILPNRLFFKYDQKPGARYREMGDQRNRAIYVSADEQDSVFCPESLAYKVCAKLKDRSIAVTATTKLLYPWPPENPVMNIGSDTDEWKNPNQTWEDTDLKDQYCERLNKVKSVTQVDISHSHTHTKRAWAYRM